MKKLSTFYQKEIEENKKKSRKELKELEELYDELIDNISYLTNFSYPVDHLKNRQNKQIIMLGFSDGTKDGGYFTANWNILKAKEGLILSLIHI